MCVCVCVCVCVCSLLTQEVLVGVFLVLPGEPAVGDVVQVFEPLKVAHSHTSSVGKQVLAGTHSEYNYTCIYMYM